MESLSVIQPSESTKDAINWIGNNDLKALAYIALAHREESTAHALAKEINEVVDPNAYASVSGYPISYVKGGFATYEWGEGGTPGNNYRAKYFRAIRVSEALRPIGALIGWSEDYDTALTIALSTTSSKGNGNAPINTVQILDGLHKGIAPTNMRLSGYSPRTGYKYSSAHNTRLETLKDIGWVEERSQERPIRIIDPRYKGTHQFRSLQPGTQSFFKTVALASDLEPDKRWRRSELEELALRSRLVDQDTVAPFRAALSKAISAKCTSFPGVFEKQELQNRQFVVKEKFQEMTRDLVERVVMVDSSPKFAKVSFDYAMSCYQPEKMPAVAYRMAKRTLNNSAHRKSIAPLQSSAEQPTMS